MPPHPDPLAPGGTPGGECEKGATYGGPCNRTACRRSGAVYWNPSTRAHYCPSCAAGINRHNPGLCRIADEPLTDEDDPIQDLASLVKSLRYSASLMERGGERHHAEICRSGATEAESALRLVARRLGERDDLLKRAMKIIASAIMHGMPITEEVAAVRNAIVRGGGEGADDSSAT